MSVPGRFHLESIWLLQLLLLGSTIVVGVLVARNTSVRKQDMRARFELENARKEMELLSLKDHLTGAWNRRYLETEFPKMAEICREQRKTLHVAVLDIDDFKSINDDFGHQLADQVLAKLGSVFIHKLGSKGRLIRLGGDEFLILYCDENLEELISQTIDELHDEPAIRQITRVRTISLSAGFASAGPNDRAEPKQLYVTADKALYSMKKNRQRARPVEELDDTVNRTGNWTL